MVYFQTKNPNLGKFWRALDGKMLVQVFYHLEYLDHLEYFHGYLGNFLAIWYILYSLGTFSGFGIMYQKNLATLMSLLLPSLRC
jgi:hypothetical protein